MIPKYSILFIKQLHNVIFAYSHANRVVTFNTESLEFETLGLNGPAFTLSRPFTEDEARDLVLELTHCMDQAMAWEDASKKITYLRDNAQCPNDEDDHLPCTCGRYDTLLDQLESRWEPVIKVTFDDSGNLTEACRSSLGVVRHTTATQGLKLMSGKEFPAAVTQKDLWIGVLEDGRVISHGYRCHYVRVIDKEPSLKEAKEELFSLEKEFQETESPTHASHLQDAVASQEEYVEILSGLTELVSQ